MLLNSVDAGLMEGHRCERCLRRYISFIVRGWFDDLILLDVFSSREEYVNNLVQLRELAWPKYRVYAGLDFRVFDFLLDSQDSQQRFRANEPYVPGMPRSTNLGLKIASILSPNDC